MAEDKEEKKVKMFNQRLYLTEYQKKIIRELMSQTREWRNEMVKLLQNNYVFTNKFEVAECVLDAKFHKYKEKYYVSKKEWGEMSQKKRDNLMKARIDFETEHRIENLLWLKTDRPLEIKDITNSPSITKEDKYAKDDEGNIIYENKLKPDGKEVKTPVRLTSGDLALLRKKRKTEPDYIKGYVYEEYLNENVNPEYHKYNDLHSLSYWEAVRNVFANYKSRMTNLFRGNIKFSRLREYDKSNIIFFGKGLAVFKDIEILRNSRERDIFFLYLPKHGERIKVIIERGRYRDFHLLGNVPVGKVEAVKVLNGRIIENNAGEFYAVLCLEYIPKESLKTHRFLGIDPNSRQESALTLSHSIKLEEKDTDVIPFPDVLKINERIAKIISKQSKARDLHTVLEMKFSKSKYHQKKFAEMKEQEKDTISKRKDNIDTEEYGKTPERKYYNLRNALPEHFNGKNQLKLKSQEKKLRQKRDNVIKNHWKLICFELFRQFDYIGMGDWGGNKDKEIKTYDKFNEELGTKTISQKIRHNLQNDMNLGYFKQFASWKAKETKKFFIEIKEPFTTQKHFGCKVGHYYNTKEYIAGKLRYRCKGCSEMVDNDKSAALNIHEILEKGVNTGVPAGKFNINLIDPDKEIQQKNVGENKKPKTKRERGK